MQKSGEDDVNRAVDDSKWKVHKSKDRFNKRKKLVRTLRPKVQDSSVYNTEEHKRKVTGTGMITSLMYQFVTSMTSRSSDQRSLPPEVRQGGSG